MNVVQLPLMPGLGHLAIGTWHAEVRCCFFGVFEPLREFKESPQHEPREVFCWEKPLGAAGEGLQIGWGGVLENDQSMVNSVSQVGGDSYGTCLHLQQEGSAKE